MWSHLKTVAKIFFVITLIDLSLCHEEDVHTIQLTQDTFDNEIKANNFFVMFFAPW